MMNETPKPALPWWRVRMLWLVLGGPALVVLAGIATSVIAAQGADEPLAASQTSAAQAPAVQVRNRGTTP
jgi:hypothetical protein